MTTTDPYAWISTKSTPQTERVLGRSDQVQNNAGGFVFTIDDMSRFRRFLTIGTAGGTYYVGERELTKDNAEFIVKMLDDVETHIRMVDELVDISVAGRAPKVQPQLLALAMLCQLGEIDGKRYARSKINDVVRTGSHLFTFVKYTQQFGGWPRGMRDAVAKWYTEKENHKLVYQLIKYRQRDGWTHRDVLRVCHPKVEDPTKRASIEWLLGKPADASRVHPMLYAFDEVNRPAMNGAAIARRLEHINLPWEALPDSAMNDTAVWDKMLDNGMPINALVRQLPRLTRLGITPQMGGRTDDVITQLLNPEAVKRSRIHPFQVLVALKTYQQGHGIRSQWAPTTKLIDALDEMYYLAFGNVEPTGKRTMNALDVSGSMAGFGNTNTWYHTRPQPGQLPLSPREISAAMAMVTVRTEPNEISVGFTSTGGNGRWASGDTSITRLPISKRQRLDDVVKTISDLRFGATDCSLPMLLAEQESMEIDTFVIYTDNETWHGRMHPFQALKQYRKASGIDARLVVVACTPTQFTIADPNDKGMLDISGFDSATPTMIADFSRGLI